jgi:glycosyltransferase involved in cell wall biosynthesis
VQTVIDHHYIWSLSGVIKNSLIRSFIDTVEKFCVKKADLNTTYADPWEYELTRISGKCAMTIYDFVDEAWPNEADRSIRKSFPEDKKVIAMPVGGHPLERTDLLIEACKDLNAMVVITGNKKFLQEHIAAARKLKLRNVIFAGFLPDRQYRGLIATCDFVANISEEPNGIPHALCEALASGRPMIISENPAVKKLLGDDCPFILSNNDASTIRNAFLLAFENQKKYVKLAAKLYGELKKRREKQLEKLFRHMQPSPEAHLYIKAKD